MSENICRLYSDNCRVMFRTQKGKCLAREYKIAEAYIVAQESTDAVESTESAEAVEVAAVAGGSEAASTDIWEAVTVPDAPPQQELAVLRFIWPLLAFLVPAAIHMIAFAALGISPFGDRTKSMMVIDNFHQYSPFLSEFREILKNGGSLLYSWNDGLGSNYWARYAYYLASPLNLFFILFPAQSLPEFIVFLSLMRTGLSGLAFFIYVKSKFGKSKADGVAFAAMYAISAYALAYYWNIMWFDCIALLPLIALGIEKIARGRSGVLYCVALAVAMYSNYYMALIICIFAVIYYATYYASGADGGSGHFIRRSARFAFCSILSAGMAAVILLPTWSALSVSQSAGAKFPTRIEFYYDVLEILSGHLFNISPSVMSGKPNLYCGVAAFILVPLFFLNKKITLREKASYGGFIVLIILSCNINYLNFIWHGLHFPNSLPYRFTFLYIFVIAAIGVKTYNNLGGVPKGAAFMAFAGASSYVLVLEKLARDIATPGVLYPSIALLALNAAAITWAAYSDKDSGADAATPAAVAFLLLTTIELSVNAGFGIGAAGAGQRDNYMASLDEVKAAVSVVKARQRGAADFFRMEFLKDTVSNTPSLYGYRGASYFSSTAVLDVTDLMGKLGFRPSSAWYIYKGSTPVINSMLSLRYLLSKEDTYDNPLYPPAGEANGVRIYENPYCLPLGFFASREIKQLSIKQPNVFKIQNDFLSRSTGLGADLGDVLRPAAIDRKNARNAEITSQSGSLYHFEVLDAALPGYLNFTISGLPAEKLLYLYIQSRQVDYVWYIKGERSEGHNIKYYPYIIDTQYFGASDEIEISLKFEDNPSGDFEMYACYFDEEEFVRAYDILNSHPLTLDSFSDTRFAGHITAERPGVLFTTVPYDRGWSVRLDGRKLAPGEIGLVGEGFMTIDIGPGTHNVEFSYMPGFFIAGLLVSAACVAVLLALIFIKRGAKIFI